MPDISTPRPGVIGRLGEHTVSRIGYGAMQLERLRHDRPEATALLRRAVELGVDHIDTAHFYGNGFVNGLLREAITPADGVTIVTKIGADPNPGGPVPLRFAQHPDELRASVEANLRSLDLQQLPVVLLRRADAGPGMKAQADQVVDLDDQLETMIALRDRGKIGAFGIGSVGAEALRRSIPAGIVFVQNAYSMVSREDEAMLELSAAENIAWVPFFPLGGAFAGFPKVTGQPVVAEAAQRLGVTSAQIGHAWLLHHNSLILIIPGTADIAHLAANVAAGAIEFDECTMAELDTVPNG
jgi:aryl-alcohol dehydrogenase-like predicted oxidoreductase